MPKLYTKPSPMGRPLTPEVQTAIRGMLQLIRKKPGIANAEVAAKLSLPSQLTSVLAKRLEGQGELKIKREGRALHLFPADVKK